jgi:hypothetical protein
MFYETGGIIVYDIKKDKLNGYVNLIQAWFFYIIFNIFLLITYFYNFIFLLLILIINFSYNYILIINK